MSESVTPVPETPTAPSNAAPGPAVGTTPPDVGASAPAPAADSPSPASETPDVGREAAPSLLGDAKPETPAEAAPAEEKPAEAPPEQPPAEEKPAEPPPLPTYEKFALPEGTQLDDGKIGEFTGILGEYENRLTADPAQAHSAMQELGQKLVDFYVADMQAATARMKEYQATTWTKTRENWVGEFRADPDIGGNRQDTTLARCGAMIDRYGQAVGKERETALRDAFSLTGMGDHPEMLRFLNWAADFAVEKARPVIAPQPIKPVPMSRAERMYRTSIPPNRGAG